VSTSRLPALLAVALSGVSVACLQPIDMDRDGFLTPGKDCDDTDPAVSPLAVEICDGVDNDCDGEIDEDVTMAFWLDADEDGAGDPEQLVMACEAPEGHVDNDLDCDDADPAARGGAAELCDGADNDCDGEIDEDDALDALVWFADADGDGHGDPLVSLPACAAPDGYVATPTDCDDADPARSPDADEICNELDDDCDGTVDEPDAVDAPTWSIDYDGDGYGSTTNQVVQCEAPRWYADNDLDCDDTDRFISPDAVEVCDGADNDCDGDTDESDAADAATWYLDGDGDGYGDATTTAPGCEPPSGHVADDTDCDDGSADTNPGADEVCDGVDNDCDGDSDEDDAVDASAWYADADGDGYGDAESSVLACSAPSDTVADATDCDDGAFGVNPGETEVCNNGLDDDCDGTSNACPLSGTLTTADADGTGTGASSSEAGRSVALTGDLDADGLADLVVGAPGDSTVWLWTGALSGTTALDADAVGLTGAGDRAGTAVAALGDVSGDGSADLLVGGAGAASGGTDRGAAWLVLGPVTAGMDLSAADAVLPGVRDGDLAGSSVALLGDSDGDGTAEVAVGGAGGAVWVVSTDTRGTHTLGNAAAVLRGGAGFGAAVLGALDVDGDGLDDLVVGGPEDAGTVSVFTSLLSGALDAEDADAVLSGSAPGNGLGTALAGVGDVDGDGYDDLLAGAPGNDSAALDAGAAYLLSGPATASGDISTLATLVITGSAGAGAGSAVAAGDVDGDGVIDLLVGAPDDTSGAGLLGLFYGPVTGSATLGGADALLSGDATTPGIGAHIASGLDVNDDAIEDFLVGTPDSGGSGAAHLFLGGGL